MVTYKAALRLGFITTSTFKPFCSYNKAANHLAGVHFDCLKRKKLFLSNPATNFPTSPSVYLLIDIKSP